MAHDGKEVELKFRVSERKFNEVKEKMDDIGEFEKSVKQRDEYFNHPNRNFIKPKFPFEWLSIRERGNKNILNYKHFYPENSEIFTHCEETELKINNAEEMKELFEALDFKHLVTVKKERKIYKTENFEIALDKVEDLGYFIEIESLKSFGNVEKTREKLFEFAKKLGIKTKPDNKGYPPLLMEKKGLIK